jgi:isocitrate dehydrogenase
MTSHPTPITIAYGDGIGPEIMKATLNILEAAGAHIAPEIIEIGESVYKQGHNSGISPAAWESIRRTKVFLKAPITTPQGGGYKSLNVTIRKSLGLFANVRPVSALHPFVPTPHPYMDLVIVRENEEDLYAGIEHRQTDEVYQCLKIVSRPGCERIIRYAFDYALAHGRKKVTCVTKDNIMKLTDGLFHDVFKDIGAEYPQLEQDHIIVDIGAARLAASPERFDVMVMPNLYGDILSDIAAEIAGSVGLAGSANIGAHGAMFEAIHGSAPDIAGKDMADPSGLLMGAVMMLVHIGQAKVAERIHNAWLKTLEDGIHTAELAQSNNKGIQAGTQDFAKAVIVRLGKIPEILKVVSYDETAKPVSIPDYQRKKRSEKELVGIDVFVDYVGMPDPLAEAMIAAENGTFSLNMITNRGVKVWPQGFSETFCTDHWRCRYLAKPGKQLNKAMIAELLGRLSRNGIDFVKTEHLFTFDGKPGYSMGQGQ